ncbi:MAG: hypothetical protein AVDCRST_MAG73-1245 [uncultured Thermomicrobiales bacterium]|uniref:Zinc-ribbon domain-containing protein n=1 Tax=uncultured Thermomicrobiales bacterium TaxID=1645740 RepID=A0A6J4TZK3_9BACT|nr:MAG: hypothetical protein AVDCRST_MAG73-1245 [uncultured Thermomicrobiales bacterium]
MIDCPNCGTSNPPDSNFCANCGAELSAARAAAPPMARPVAPADLPAFDPEWRMSDPGPLPEPRRRRTWVWVLLGIVGACLLVCIALFIWTATDSGQATLEDWSTRLAEEQERAE